MPTNDKSLLNFHIRKEMLLFLFFAFVAAQHLRLHYSPWPHLSCRNYGDYLHDQKLLLMYAQSSLRSNPRSSTYLDKVAELKDRIRLAVRKKIFFFCLPLFLPFLCSNAKFGRVTRKALQQQLPRVGPDAL